MLLVAAPDAMAAQGLYHDFEGAVAVLEDAALAHPEVVALEIVGTSAQGRPIWAARVTDRPNEEEADEPVVRVTGATHGPEIAGVEVALGLFTHLVEAYAHDPELTDLIDARDVWIIPILNPDGFVAGRRNNGAGVDLNRDYGFAWAGWGASPAPFSQPETRALAREAMTRPAVWQVDLHGVAKIVNHLWDSSPLPTRDEDILASWSATYAAFTGYRVVRGYAWREVRGSAQDAAYGLFGALAWTIETPQPHWEPKSIVDSNVRALVALVARAGEGIHGAARDASSDAPLAARVEVLDRDVSTWASQGAGGFHRPLPEGRYALRVSAPGCREQVLLGVEVPAVGPLEVRLDAGGGDWAHRLVSTADPDAGAAELDPGTAAHILGAPDRKAFALGAGGAVVVDLGRLVVDGPGDDLRVLAFPPGNGYAVEAGVDPWDNRTPLGAALETATFDLAAGGLGAARYVRVVAGAAGVGLDAIGRAGGGPELALLEAQGGGGTLALTVVNLGETAAGAVVAMVTGDHPALRFDPAGATLGDLGPEQSATATVGVAATERLDPERSMALRVTLSAGGQILRETAVFLPLGEVPQEPAAVTLDEPGCASGAGHSRLLAALSAFFCIGAARRRRAGPVLPALVLAACAGEGGASDALDDAVRDAASGLEMEVATPVATDSEMAAELEARPLSALPPVAWVDLGVHALDASARTEWIDAPFDANPRFVAIRVRPSGAGDPSLCYRLEPVELASGASLVGAPEAQEPGEICTQCTQRVMSGHGYGLFTFPNDGAPLAEADTLRFRVQLRVCADGTLPPPGGALPSAVAVDGAQAPSVSPEAQGELRVRVAVASQATDGGPPILETAAWAEIWERARAHYAEAGVTLVLERQAIIPGPPVGILHLGPSEREELDAAHAEAMAALAAEESDVRFVPLVVVRCLLYRPYEGALSADIVGQTARIPGGAPVGGAASGVFLAITGCLTQVQDPDAIGFILTHELGHHLGLHHSDTAYGAHRAAPAANNLMASGKTANPLGATWSAAQIDVLRRHFDVAYP